MLPVILRMPAVRAAFGFSRSTIYLQIKKGLLTKPVHLTKRTTVWPASEISAILEARIAGKTDEEIQTLVVDLENKRLSWNKP